MRLQVLAFGKLKTPGLREAADYYSGLIRPYVAAEEVELKPLPVPDKSASTREQIQTKEAELVLQKFNSHSGGRNLLYLLDEGGKSLSTTEWADQVRSWEAGSFGTVTLCIGSSLGFSKLLRTQAKGILSLGPQTLPHELARVVLLEQIYRAWSVVRGHPYHVDR